MPVVNPASACTTSGKKKESGNPSIIAVVLSLGQKASQSCSCLCCRVRGGSSDFLLPQGEGGQHKHQQRKPAQEEEVAPHVGELRTLEHDGAEIGRAHV